MADGNKSAVAFGGLGMMGVPPGTRCSRLIFRVLLQTFPKPREGRNFSVVSRGGEDVELLGQLGIGIEGKSRLPFAHHVDHFDTVEDDAGGCERFEAEHRPNTALDPPTVLLDAIVQVLALADSDRLHSAPAAILQLICRVTGNDCLKIGLAAVDDDALGPTMALQRFPEEALGPPPNPGFC